MYSEVKLETVPSYKQDIEDKSGFSIVYKRAVSYSVSN